MKKIVNKMAAIAMTTAMVCSLTACSGSAKPEAPAADEAGSSAEASAKAESSGKNTGTAAGKGRIAYINAGLGDKSFNDSAESGIQILRGQGWDCKTVETGDETKADKWEDITLDTIDEGYEYVVASSSYRDVMMKLAKENPEVKFVIFDENMDESEIPENMAVIFYAQNEGSYMVGQLAAGMSKSKVVAVNVGMDNPVIADFVTGFVNGVKAYDPDCKVVKSTVGSWTDPAKMKELCLAQARDKNADIFYQVAGGSGAGLFEACKETGTWAIGVDSDQYAYYKDSESPELADVILTSMEKRVGDSFVSFFADVEAGKDVWKKVNTLGLKDHAVGYTDNDYFRSKVPAEVIAEMEETQAGIISGEIKVPSYYDFADESEYQALLDSVAP